MPQSYNFFGMSPAQQQAPVDPSLLALQMYNNPTSSQTQPSQSAGAINPQALAKMMMQNSGGQGNGQPVASDGLQVGQLYNGGNPNDIPGNAQSYNTGVGPLPWLPQNALPWSGGNGGS